jgi:hypothetical protein
MSFRTGAHCGNRLFEWVSAAMLLGIGLILVVSPQAVELGAFRHLPGGLWPLFVLFALARAFGLWANGHWDVIGPRLRALGALVGAMLWFQMFIALLMQASEVGSASLGVAVYPCLVMGELISCYRAAGDVRGYS